MIYDCGETVFAGRGMKELSEFPGVENVALAAS
jgi:hypothetical protein